MSESGSSPAAGEGTLAPVLGFRQMLRGTPQPKRKRDDPKRLDELRNSRLWLRESRGKGLLAVGVVALVVVVVLALRGVPIVWPLGVIGLAAALVFWLLYYFSPAEIEQEIRVLEIEFEMDKTAPEANAYRLFKLHQFELEKYYQYTLHNNKVLMWVGLACLTAGLGIVIASGVWVAGAQEGGRADMLVAGLGAVGGILANYVAAVYLKMNAAASQALNDFHNRLVSTHHLHFGNFLASRIHTQVELEATLKEMATQLARR